MANGTNANLLQVLSRQTWQDPLVYLILAECRLVSFEAQAPQPFSEVHNGAPMRSTSAHIINRAKRGVQKTLEEAHSTPLG